MVCEIGGTWASIMQCFFTNMGITDATAIGTVILIFVLIFVAFLGLPGIAILPLMVVLMFSLYMVTTSPVFLAFFFITLIVTAAAFISGITKRSQGV